VPGSVPDVALLHPAVERLEERGGDATFASPQVLRVDRAIDAVVCRRLRMRPLLMMLVSYHYLGDTLYIIARTCSPR
jgi:hypothetical protein